MHESPSPPPSLPERRSFLQGMTYLLGAAAAALVGVPFVGYLLGALRKSPVLWVDLGPVNEKNFPRNETRLKTFDNLIRQPWDGMAAFIGVYVRNVTPESESDPKKSQFLVFAMNCAHLGCPVTWFPQSGLFMCPCHGGVYYENGDHASGPPPRGLFKCVWEVRDDSKLWIQAPHLPTLQNTLEKPA